MAIKNSVPSPELSEIAPQQAGLSSTHKSDLIILTNWVGRGKVTQCKMWEDISEYPASFLGFKYRRPQWGVSFELDAETIHLFYDNITDARIDFEKLKNIIENNND